MAKIFRHNFYFIQNCTFLARQSVSFHWNGGLKSISVNICSAEYLNICLRSMNEIEQGFAESHFQSWKTLVLVTTFYPSEGLYFLKKFTLVTTFYPIDASNLAARTFQSSDRWHFYQETEWTIFIHIHNDRSQFQHFTISVLRIEWTWYKVHEGFSAQKLFCNAEFLSNMHHHQNLNQSHDIAKMVDFQENHTIYIIKYTSTYLP